MSLLDKAKEIAPTKGREVSTEEIDVGLAWVCDEITARQGKHALGISDSSPFYSRVAVILREAVRRGLLVPRCPSKSET